MKLWHLLIGGLVLAAFSGCRTNGGQEWLEQEMRQLEDQVYLYQDQARRSQMQLETARRENAALRKELDAKGGPGPAGAAPPPGMPGVNIEIPDGAPGALPAPPSVDAGPPEPPVAPGAKAPETLPEPSRSRVRSLPEGEFKAPATLPAPPDAMSAPPAAEPAPPATPPQSPPAAPQAPAEAPAAPAMPDEQGPAILPVPAPSAGPRGDSARVNTLMINRLLTSGYSTDGKPGDQGVTAVIEPRDADGRLINAAGPVSVVVIDPLLEGSRRRVGRWDFTAEQTASRFRQTALGQGLHLELPWPNRPPTNKHLKLYVRYQTRDGRKLIAQRDIDIDAPGRRPTATLADSTAGSVPRVAPGTAAPKTPTASPASKPSRAWTPAPAAATSPAAKAGVEPPAAEAPSWTPARDDKPARSEATEPLRATSQARRPEWRPYR